MRSANCKIQLYALWNSKNVSTAKTFLIGVLLKHLQDNLMLNGIMATAQKHGYTIFNL